MMTLLMLHGKSMNQIDLELSCLKDHQVFAFFYECPY